MPPAEPPAASSARPAAAQPPEAKSAGSSAAAAPIGADLRAAWVRLKAQVREKDKLTETLLNSCAVAGMDGNLLKLTTQVKLACEKINDQAPTRQLVADLLSDIMGFPCNVQCTYVGGPGAPTRSAKSHDRAQNGPMAAVARDLGGEIVED